MAPETTTSGASVVPAADQGRGTKEKDWFASMVGQIPHLPSGHRAALRRLFLTRSDTAVGVVTGLLVRAGAPEAVWAGSRGFAQCELVTHVAAVLSGTAGTAPHRPGARLGRALHAAGYSDHRLMRLTSARGGALVDQILRATRVLAAAGQVPVDLRTIHQLSSDTIERAEAARLQIARDYYAAEHAREKDQT